MKWRVEILGEALSHRVVDPVEGIEDSAGLDVSRKAASQAGGLLQPEFPVVIGREQFSRHFAHSSVTPLNNAPQHLSGPGDSTRHRGDAGAGDLGRLPVAAAFDRDQEKCRSLIFRQLRDRRAHRREFQPGHRCPLAVQGLLGTHLDSAELLAPCRLVAHLVPVKVVRNPVHPTVEPGSRLPLVEIDDGALDGCLGQIVGRWHGPCEPQRKPSQTRQESDDLLLDLGFHAPNLANALQDYLNR